MLLSPDSEFFRYFEDPMGRSGDPAPAPARNDERSSLPGFGAGAGARGAAVGAGAGARPALALELASLPEQPAADCCLRHAVALGVLFVWLVAADEASTARTTVADCVDQPRPLTYATMADAWNRRSMSAPIVALTLPERGPERVRLGRP